MTRISCGCSTAGTREALEGGRGRPACASTSPGNRSEPALAPSFLAGVDWRQKLENQRGAVLATEMKNNANKIAKWTAAALVA